jgi:hypothetical protein
MDNALFQCCPALPLSLWEHKSNPAGGALIRISLTELWDAPTARNFRFTSSLASPVHCRCPKSRLRSILVAGWSWRVHGQPVFHFTHPYGSWITSTGRLLKSIAPCYSTGMRESSDLGLLQSTRHFTSGDIGTVHLLQLSSTPPLFNSFPHLCFSPHGRSGPAQ